jgi:hypothetical protein
VVRPQLSSVVVVKTVTPAVVVAKVVNPSVIVTGVRGPTGLMGSTGATGPQGETGLQGPPGPAGSSYTHNQGSPSTVWSINHNLGMFPNITVIDSAGSVVEGEERYLDPNNVVLTFSGAFSGTAYLS